MTSLPSPPFVDVSGVSNFRDIGGQPTAKGIQVRRGLVFRSADPSKATEEGLKTMGEVLGITTVFDLRSTPEIQRDGPEWEGLDIDSADIFKPYGIARVWNPVFADEDYGPDQVAVRYKDYATQGPEGFVRAYKEILQSGVPAYSRIFRYFAKVNPTPCLINCTAGKDRTGVVIALLLTLAGVSSTNVAEEYALTDSALAELKPIFIERLLKNPALEGNRDGVWRMVSSKKENMEAALKMIESDFGGVEKYLKENCALSDEELEQIRQNLLQNDDLR